MVCACDPVAVWELQVAGCCTASGQSIFILHAQEKIKIQNSKYNLSAYSFRTILKSKILSRTT